MAEIVGEIVGRIVGRIVVDFVAVIITETVRSYRQQRRSKKLISSSQKQNQLSTQNNRAVLISSSNITFGNDCERLVNIVFQTSQTFPTIISTYSDAQQYLRTELSKQYPSAYFHIIIGENQSFGFSVDDGQYFAEIEQDRYRVLIFTTKQSSSTKSDTHDANSQMIFVWN